METKERLQTYIADLLVRDTGSGDPSRVHRGRGEAAGKGPPVQSAVDDGAVLSFVDNVPGGQREDVLNSVQLAQRAATGSFDRHTQTEPWYQKFAEVLQRVGWVVEQFAFVKHEQSTGDLRLDKSALAIQAAIASENALGVLTKSIGALQELADDANQIAIFNSAATQKNRMNQGHWIRALLFSVIAVTTDRGTIQSARASLIVVPTANAVGPYFAVAPTTELVS